MGEQSEAISLVEACYRVDLDDRAWLQGLADAANNVLTDGLGVLACTYQASAGLGAIDALAPAGGFDLAWTAAFYRRLQEPGPFGQAPPRFDSWFDRACGTVLSVPGLDQIGYAMSELGGAVDQLGLHGRDPTGSGVWLGVPLREPGVITPEQNTLYTRFAAHMVAGARIRRRLQQAERAEAIIDGGKLVHAEPSAQPEAAQKALQQAVIGLDAARSARGRQEPLMATAQWKGLTSARWTLLDEFDTDGRRFVVAYRNDAQVAAPRQLSERERQVLVHGALGHTNKEIAYELGLSMPTVRVLMHRAGQKLGVSTRADAIALYRESIK